VQLVELIVIGLAGFRLAYLFQREEGPFTIFVRMRRLLGFVLDDDGQITSYPDTSFHRGFACMVCLSMWLVFVSAGLWFIEPWIPVVIAASSIGLLIEEYRG
jgi:hypothetical protein